MIPQSLIYLSLTSSSGDQANVLFYNLNESSDSISPAAMVRSQDYTKLACGIMTVIC